MEQFIETNRLILMEGAIIEQLRRSGSVRLHDTLVNAPLIYESTGKKALAALYRSYLEISQEAGVPFIMCTPTWRANRSRVTRSHVSRSVNIDAALFMKDLLSASDHDESSIRVGGMIGCKNDCYLPAEGLGAAESGEFHSWQISQLVQGGVDFLLAATLPSVEEATGIAKAMEATGLPYMLSFVINRHGYILDGTGLVEAIGRIDSATGRKPAGYMVNCAYPGFLCAEQQPAELFSRLVGYQANGSSLDHCDLDNAPELKTEKVFEWGDAMLDLNRRFGVRILGGCCGTGVGHLRYIVSN